METPRPEYPRPMFVREDWINLNGEWEFEFDDANRGITEGWFDRHDFTRRIVVPFTFESTLSGIGDTSVHEVVWYRRKLRLPELYRGRRIMLNFGAVDFAATVWVNGEQVGQHRGGYTPFGFDITECLRPENQIVVRIEDRLSKEQPRGKQFWEPRSKGCHYTRATGIWQSVWIEPVSVFHFTNVQFQPDIDKSIVHTAVGLSGHSDRMEIRARFSINSELRAETKLKVGGDQTAFETWLSDSRLWSVDEPNLYNVLLELHENGTIYDRVLACFGMRKVSIESGRVLLNNHPIRLKLVLDQGYFPDGIYTAPSDEAFIRDIQMTKALGFNGVRKHQKVEDPRYYYWCDRLGLLVWGEMGNCYEFSDVSMANLASEWPHVIKANFNHPSIITWVPFNESWGIEGVQNQDRPQEFVGQIVAFSRELDPTRPVVDNSGWSHVDTDIVDLHEYSQDAGYVYRILSGISPTRPTLPTATHHVPALADGFTYNGQPIVVSEYGGIALSADAHDGAWGYGDAAEDTARLVSRYRDLTGAILKNTMIAGFCYTQLYDIEQEVNGLLTYDRRPKVSVEQIAEINREETTEWGEGKR